MKKGGAHIQSQHHDHFIGGFESVGDLRLITTRFLCALLCRQQANT
jgi:hypothetical protein